MPRDNYSLDNKCADCGISITNAATKCASCNTRAVGNMYRGMKGRRRKYQAIFAMAPRPSPAQPPEPTNVAFVSRAKGDYRLGLHCEQCGAPRTDKSRALCLSCYSQGYKPDFAEPAVRMELSPWQTLPDGTLMRTATGV